MAVRSCSSRRPNMECACGAVFRRLSWAHPVCTVDVRDLGEKLLHRRETPLLCRHYEVVFRGRLHAGRKQGRCTKRQEAIWQARSGPGACKFAFSSTATGALSHCLTAVSQGCLGGPFPFPSEQIPYQAAMQSMQGTLRRLLCRSVLADAAS